MALILNIESSTTNCSVSLAHDGHEIASRAINDGYSHAERLAPYVEEIIIEAKIKKNQLEAIAVSGGPGSYTGLRIGVSLAKGLCFALNLPLISVSTLEVMCLDQSVQRKAEGMGQFYLCPMVDARRMEVYSALYDHKLTQLQSNQPIILENNSYEEELSDHQIIFFGNGSDKFAEICDDPNAHFMSDIWPDARQMIRLSEDKYSKRDIEDLAYFEPNYLKAFQATTPKKLF